MSLDEVLQSLFENDEEPDAALKSKPEAISGLEVTSKQIHEDSSCKTEEISIELPKYDKVSKKAHQQALRSLLQQGFKNLYQESLNNQLQNEKNHV